MPRDEVLIQTFDKGIQSGFDQADIEKGAAAWSIEENPESVLGTVQPRMTDTAAFDTNNSYAIEKHAWITREDGKRDLVFYNARDGHIEAISDFNGSPSYGSVLGHPSGTSIAMNTINRAVRIGDGTNASKYAGYVDYGQFGASATTSLQYEDAKLKEPESFPQVHKMVIDASYGYAIEWQGRYIYKFSKTGGMTDISEMFVQLQAICDCDTDHLYVYDNDGPYGKILKITKATLKVDETYTLSGFAGVGTSLSTGTAVSDMEATAAYLWIASYKDDYTTTTAEADRLIYKIALASLTDGAIFYPSDSTWTWLNGPVAGKWYSSGTVTMYPTPFIRGIESDVIGITVHIDGYLVGSGANAEPHDSIILIKESAGAGELFNSSTLRLGSMGDISAAINGGVVLNGDISVLVLQGVSNANLYSYVGDDLQGRTVMSFTAFAWGGGNPPFTVWTFSTVAKSGGITVSAIAAAAATAHTGTFYVAAGHYESNSYTPRYYSQIVALQTAEGTFSSASLLWITPTYITLTKVTVPEGILDITKKYYYKAVLEYDRYQLSPLMKVAVPVTLSAGYTSVKILLELRNISASLRKRASAVYIYRADGESDSDEPNSLYRLVQSFDLTEGWDTDNSEVSTWTHVIYRKVYYDTGNYGSSYESDSGIAETLPNNTMNYTIACTGNGYHFIGQASNEELENVSNLIFRSKKNAPDMFDWSNDYCVLPTRPIALHFFKGYLYAFDSTRMYVIDAESLVLIGQYEGYGVQSDLAIASNESAMFFANNENVFMHDGKNPVIISVPINVVGTSVVGTTSHRTLAASRTIVMSISPKFNALVIAYPLYVTGSLPSNISIHSAGTGYSKDDILTVSGGTGGTIKVDSVDGSGGVTSISLTSAGSGYVTSHDCATTRETVGASGCTVNFTVVSTDTSGTPMFLFHFMKQAWYYWLSTNVSGSNIDCTTLDKRSLIVDYLGNMYFSVYKGMIKLCGSTTAKTCTWYSKLINFGDQTTLNKIYKVLWDGSVTTAYADFNNAQTFGESLTSGAYMSSPSTKRSSLQLKFTLANNKILKGITIIFRKMIGLR